jgi:hypothetical protein
MKVEETKFNEEQEKRLVGIVSFVRCNICKKDYVPDDKDVSLNGNLYYKNCRICRRNRVEMKQKSLNKTKLLK